MSYLTKHRREYLPLMMNYLRKIALIVGILFMIIPPVGAFILFSTPIYEAYTGHESIILKSEGDCRIKNIELALTKSIPHVYFLKNKQTGLVHVLAIDNDKKFYDQSNGKYSEGDFFDYYEKEYLIIYIANIINKKVENSVFDSKKELTIERLGYAYYINLFLFFK